MAEFIYKTNSTARLTALLLCLIYRLQVGGESIQSSVFYSSAALNNMTKPNDSTSNCPRKAFSEIRRRYACKQSSFLADISSNSSMSLLTAAVSHAHWQAGITTDTTAAELLRLAGPRLLFKLPHSAGLLLEPLELLFGLTWTCGGREQPADWWRLVLTTFCRQLAPGRFLPYGQTLPNQVRSMWLKTVDDRLILNFFNLVFYFSCAGCCFCCLCVYKNRRQSSSLPR